MKIIFSLLLLFFVGAFSLKHIQTVPTPMGRMPRECVHHVESGSKIIDNENHTVVISPSGIKSLILPCPYQIHSIIANEKVKRHSKPHAPMQYDGWLAYTSFRTPDKSTFDTFLGYFSVPNNPSNTPEVLYIFTGLQNDDWVPLVDPQPQVFDIIQPVLQYPSDNGYGWSVKSWYVTLNSGVLVSSEILVSSGDNIYGNMTRLAQTEWYIGGTSSNSGQTASLSVNRQRLLNQPWSFNTIECYGCQDCSYLPTNTCQFSKLSLTYRNGQPIAPSWTPYTSPNPVCGGTHANVQGPSAVSFTFQ